VHRGSRRLSVKTFLRSSHRGFITGHATRAALHALYVECRASCAPCGPASNCLGPCRTRPRWHNGCAKQARSAAFLGRARGFGPEAQCRIEFPFSILFGLNSNSNLKISYLPVQSSKNQETGSIILINQDLSKKNIKHISKP
jgi:hypothetical protein